MMLKRVISGGQTGADQAALLAAEDCAIKTGGTAPKGYRTQTGPNRELKKRFGLEESYSSDYPPRTRRNVMDAEATLIFGKPSPGTKLTVKLCQEFDRPYAWIKDVPEPKQFAWGVAEWLFKRKVRTLNVAGNREETHPGITRKVRAILRKEFVRLRKLCEEKDAKKRK